jgi:hypothetical protein
LQCCTTSGAKETQASQAALKELLAMNEDAEPEDAEPEEDCETADSDTSLVPRSRKKRLGTSLDMFHILWCQPVLGFTECK